MRNWNNRISRQKELGSTTLFFAAIILPLLFFFFSLSLDLTAYYAEAEKAQRLVDDAALHAYKFLPYTDKAKEAAIGQLERYGEFGTEGLTVKVSGDGVDISLERIVPLKIGSLFGLSQAGIPISAFSRAVGTPFDGLILMDDSHYIAPEKSSGVTWGDTSDWPAAFFFRNSFVVEPGVSERSLTQQCFNPAFNTVKSVAVTAYDYLSAFSKNAVGVGFFPGTGKPIDLARDLTPVRDDNGQRAARFFNYRDPYSTAVADSYCAAASEIEETHNSSPTQSYLFPSRNQSAPYQESHDLDDDGQDDRHPSRYLPKSFEYNSEYGPYLTTRESIWLRAARQYSLASGTPEEAETNIDQIIMAVREHLLGAPIIAARRSMAGVALKKAIIVSGDVPHVAGERFPVAAVKAALTAQLDKMAAEVKVLKQDLTMYYLVFPHPGNGPELELRGRVTELEKLFADHSSADTSVPYNVSLRVVYSSNPEVLSKTLIGSIVLDRKTAVLAR